MRDGFLIVDKPSGATSFSMVGLVRRLTGVRRVGHAGTLDPLASGVLPVAVGVATRLIEYMDDDAKVYRARVRLGTITDTYDAEGAVVASADASHVTASAVREALPAFVGDIAQVPPMYSALKLAGKPLYRYAREGAAIDLPSRQVHISRIDLLSFSDGEAEIEVECGKGTYIRSLAHDLGRRLGCGAHLAGLVRVRSGGFGLEQAHAPGALVDAHAAGTLADLLLAADRAVERRHAVILADGHAREVAAGRDIALETAPGPQVSRAYSLDGELLAMLERRTEGAWHPRKVMAQGSKSPDRVNFG